MKRSLLLALAILWSFTLSAQTILTQNFENGLGNWQAISMNTENNNYFGLNNLETTAHSGSYYFQFNSYSSAANYNQYLISPRFELSNTARLEYYAIDASGHHNETFEIMVSSTDSAISSFTALGSSITAPSAWTMYTVTLPANTKFIAFHYTGRYEYRMGIDDISIFQESVTPEIALQQINFPPFVDAGENFNIEGTVVNNSQSTLTSFEAAYTIDGVTTTGTIQGISVAPGSSYSFTHPTVASLTTSGLHGITLTVSNPNGQADNTSDNSLTDTINVCGIISTMPYTQDFESGMYCWQAVSMNSNNTIGVVTSANSHSGSSYFRFCSYYSASDYTQYLISPQLSLSQPIGFSFYAKDTQGDEEETIQVMVSTTDDQPGSFTNVGDEIEVRSSWHQHTALIPANVKYVAIKYTAHYQYYTGIDDINFFAVNTTPEIELTQATAPYMESSNTPFNLTAKIINHSSTPVTQFTVAYTVNGTTTTDQITGCNVEYNQTYEFTIPTPVVLATAGHYNITVTVSNPNGQADDASDNTVTTEVEIYAAANTVHRKILMEHFSTASCPNCYDGHVRLHEAIEGYEDDVIWITHHVGYYTDRLTADASHTFKTFYNDNSGTYAPGVMLDRTYWGDFEFSQALGVPPGPVFYPHNNMDQAFATATTVPAYVTIAFSQLSYDATTRQLNVTVSGQVTGAIDAADPRLNVWLLEDSILADGATGPGHGPTQSYAPDGFTHDHVLRELLNNDNWGEANIVSSTAGSTYSKTYTFTVSEDYIADQCYLVAFISEGNHSNINNCRVYNAEKSRKLTAPDDGGNDDPHTSFALTYNNQPLHHNDTITQSVTNYELSNLYIGYANISSQEINFRVRRDNLTLAPGAESGFCISNTCYTGNYSMEIPLAAGEVIDAAQESLALHATYMSIENGTSIVKYTLFNTADTTDAVSFFIRYQSGTGVDAHSASPVKIYPNPASTCLYIGGIDEPCSFVIYSLTGQSVMKGELNRQITVESLPAGTYILEICRQNHLERLKFIKVNF